MKADYMVIPGANHYTMAENMLDTNSSLTRAMLGQMGL
jgi:hypothetical protein